MQMPGQDFDAGAVRVDDAFAADAHSGGKRGGFEQPADAVLQRGQEAVQVGGSLDGAGRHDGALFIHHARFDPRAADIDAEHYHENLPASSRPSNLAEAQYTPLKSEIWPPGPACRRIRA